MSTQGQEGVNVFLSWGIVEWLVTGTVSACAAMGGWIWHLAGRVDRLETLHEANREEIDDMKKTIRNVGSALDNKIDEETHRLEDRMAKVLDKVDELRADLPSRAFIDTQLMALSGRLDRTIDNKLAGR